MPICFKRVMVLQASGVCKLDKTKTRANQDLWLELLESVCRIGQVECYVWRPADWQKITQRLTSQTKRKV